jgi:hypothetical protein
MNNPDTELLFPMRVIPQLIDLREQVWKNLVESVVRLPDSETRKIAFSALMVKIAGCTGCNSDSYRAMRGCTQCARVTIKRYKGSDEDLLKLYQENLNEIALYIEKRKIQTLALERIER